MPHLLKSYISYVAFLEGYHAHSDPLPRTLLFTLQLFSDLFRMDVFEMCLFLGQAPEPRLLPHRLLRQSVLFRLFSLLYSPWDR